MVEKIGRVSNPLTIIAIFAGIAEISGTVVLPLLSEKNQSIFLWYVMFFPVLLVICFFLTLIFNHGVLYGPGDYKDDISFLHMANRLDVKDSSSSTSRFEISSSIGGNISA